MGRVCPRRAAIVVAITFVGGSSKRHAPTLAVPQVETGRGGVRTISPEPLGSVELVAVAVTSGCTESVRVDGRQLFALNRSGERIAPLPPGEGVRLAKAHGVPGSLGGSGRGGATGGVRGALGEAIPGAIHPEGSDDMHELLLNEAPSGRVVPERVSIAPDA